MTGERPPVTRASGREKSLKKALLETGADVLQDTTPMKQFDVYMVGFHPMKHDPGTQIEAHHYCHQVNEDVIQCVLFDGNTADANLVGVEYIVSERVFESLPESEKEYWHPHNYEILGGILVAPGLPEVAEKAMMRTLMNSYGKTWHTWLTSSKREPRNALPLGEPLLAWSFNRDGESDAAAEADAERALGTDFTEKRRARADLAEHARPQRGVNALEGAFGDVGARPEGVVDVDEARAGERPREARGR